MQDLGNELLGRPHGNGELRPEEFWAVRDVNFELKRGECLGLIGHNGAGKTTLLRMLNGLIKPDQGRIEMRGRVGALIALGAGFNPILTGRENIYVNASVLGLSKREIDDKIDEIIDFAEIDEFIDVPVQNYSSGMQVRLGFAVATTLEPDILLLDEILAVGDAAFRVKCFNRIQDLMNDCAVIFVSHNMSQVTRISNQLLLLRKGRVESYGTEIGEIIAHYHEQIEVKNKQAEEGTGRSDIKSVEILDKYNNHSSTIGYGDPYAIVVTYELSGEAKNINPRLLITIGDQEGNNVAQVIESLGNIYKSSIHEARIEFDNMQLNAGRYWLTTSILLNEHGELSCVRRNVASIIVKNSYVGYASVILNCKRILITDSNLIRKT
jgi:lipopolysaccharide transport system ATP-binding protein